MGSTGSLGTQALQVVDSLPGNFEVLALAAGYRTELLFEQIRKYKPRYYWHAAQGSYDFNFKSEWLLPSEMTILPEADLVLITTSGTAGLLPTIAALKAGKTVALANQPCGKIRVNGGTSGEIDAAPRENFDIIEPNCGAEVTTKIEPLLVEAPIEKGMKVGTITAFIDGVPAASADLCALNYVGSVGVGNIWQWTMKFGVAVFCLLVGGKYGAAFTKGSRRRRRGITSTMRDFNNFR